MTEPLVRVRARVRTRMLLVGGVVLLLLWLGLAAAVRAEAGPFAIDSAVWTWALEHRSGPLTGFVRGVTLFGENWFMTLVLIAAVILLSVRGENREALFLVGAGAGNGLLVVLCKEIIARHRPSADGQLVDVNSFSFPSGHAMGAAGVVSLLVILALGHLRSPLWRALTPLLAVVFVLAIGASRVYLGVHWVTDVVGGWLLAGAWITLCCAWRSARRAAGTWTAEG
ncbi:phosphatase PAP2 family protein [Pseudonocardiaceae bacterium YIM PH 21723]|nr:phosphatase PAP2 family protein [Pseudonocardiaceae bacterium YIM PH 21723]